MPSLIPPFLRVGGASAAAVAHGLIGSLRALPAAAVVLGPLLAAGPVAAAPVATAVAQAGVAGGARQLDGTLQPVRQATVAAQVSGSVLALNVKAGDAVRKGQVLARVDDRNTQAGVLQAEASVAQADAALRSAQLQIDRSRQLKAQGFVSQAALDQASVQLQTAQAGMRQAQAARQQAGLAQGFTSVTAPYDAVVLATLAEPGDLAAPGRGLVTLYVPGSVRAVVQVPASLADGARQASEVFVRLPDGREVVPAQRQLLPTADAVSQTIEWRLDLPASAGAALRPGEAVQVRWQSPLAATAAVNSTASATRAPAADAAARAPLAVPAAAVLQRGELTAMYVAQGQRFVLRAVRTGQTVGGRVQVLAGLQPGERYALDAIAAGLADATPAP